MNKESWPLILAILIPVVLVTFSLLYFFGYDFIKFFREIDLLYYIIVFPIVVGFLIAIFRWKKE